MSVTPLLAGNPTVGLPASRFVPHKVSKKADMNCDLYKRPDQIVKVDVKNCTDLHSVFVTALGSAYTLGMSFQITYLNCVSGAVTQQKCNRYDSRLTEQVQQNADPSQPICAWWEVESHNVYFFGTGVGQLSNKTLVCEQLKYQSHKGMEHLMTELSLVLQEKKKNKEKKGHKVNQPEMTPAPYNLVVEHDSQLMIIEEANVVVMNNRTVFLSPLQASYSNVNVLEMKKFDIPGVHAKDPKQLLDVMKQTTDQTAFHDQISVAINFYKITHNSYWDERIKFAVEELASWARVIPSQRGFNEETRRIIAQIPCKAAALLLGRPFYVELPLCVGPPPSHFHGSGPLDCIIGGGTLPGQNAPPTAVMSGVHFPNADDTEKTDEADTDSDGNDSDGSDSDGSDSDEEEDEPQQKMPGSPLPAAVEETVDPQAVNVELKVPSTANALEQVSAETNDLSFVSADALQEVADNSGKYKDPLAMLTTEEKALKKKRKLEPVNTLLPTRVYTRMCGIISTGHNWDVLMYTTSSNDPTEKMRITYLGSLRMPVLTYKPANAAAASSSAADAVSTTGPRGSGSAERGFVDTATVEAVVAMLMLACEGKLGTN